MKTTRPRRIGKDIRQLLSDGLTYNEIRQRLNVSKSSISYHARKLGREPVDPTKYDWKEVQIHIDAGLSFTECQKIFGFNAATFYDAVKKKKITDPVNKRNPYISATDYVNRVMGKAGRKSRFNMKIKLIRDGILEKRCSICGLDHWLGQELPLRLDHIDGDGGNFSLCNLRLLCGNCDSLQDTFCHRNVGKGKAGMAERQTRWT